MRSGHPIIASHNRDAPGAHIAGTVMVFVARVRGRLWLYLGEGLSLSRRLGARRSDLACPSTVTGVVGPWLRVEDVRLRQ